MASLLQNDMSIWEAAKANLEYTEANYEKHRKAMEERDAKEAEQLKRIQVIAKETLESNLQCMNQYRNKSGALQMPKRFRKKPFKDSQVYYYHGHGITVCDKEGYPVIKTVPPGCIYITQTVCGIVNEHNDKILEAFCNRKTKHVWKDPVTFLPTLKQLLRLAKSSPGIHIHLPGCSYVDTQFLPLGSHNLRELGRQEDGTLLHLSGLMNLEVAHKTPDRESNPYRNGITFVTDRVEKDLVKNSFRYSFYPKLLESSANTPPDNQTLVLTVAKDGTVSFTDVQKKIDDIADANPVSTLLERFPGIHYNFTCRSIPLGCKQTAKEAVTLRRSLSALVQNTIYDTIDQLIRMGYRHSNAKANRGFAEDASIAKYIESVLPEIRKDPDFPRLLDSYSTAASYGYEKSKSLLKDVIQTLYLPVFNELLQKYEEAEQEGNDTKRLARLHSIKEHITALQMDPILAYQDRQFPLEVELLTTMALTALRSSNTDLFEYLCRQGASAEKISAFLESIGVNPGFYTDQFAKCKDFFEEEYAKSSSSNNGRFSNRGSPRRTNRSRSIVSQTGYDDPFAT